MICLLEMVHTTAQEITWNVSPFFFFFPLFFSKRWLLTLQVTTINTWRWMWKVWHWSKPESCGRRLRLTIWFFAKLRTDHTITEWLRLEGTSVQPPCSSRAMYSWLPTILGIFYAMEHVSILSPFRETSLAKRTSSSLVSKIRSPLKKVIELKSLGPKVWAKHCAKHVKLNWEVGGKIIV